MMEGSYTGIESWPTGSPCNAEQVAKCTGTNSTESPTQASNLASHYPSRKCELDSSKPSIDALGLEMVPRIKKQGIHIDISTLIVKTSSNQRTALI
jgi:hypothetical protein